mmetsp:Transcript_24045/g.47142  ORF Transcript_24045/g.47142 Transcript_24045/m.47142 type:complete len:359 (+) Transcript_24045:30-1106(+)
MGMGCSTSEESKRSNMIQRQLRSHSNDNSKVIRILLLGASECGKSTILKQMKILHTHGFTDNERHKIKGVIRLNTVQAIQQLLVASKELDIDQDDVFKKHAPRVLMLDHTAARGLPTATIEAIDELWKDSKTIQTTLAEQARGTRFYLLDSARYMLNRVRKSFSDDYVPGNQDILYTRLPSKGITETIFTVEGARFKMIDVGGQRSERRKWIQCFDDVRAILFVISLSEYDQVLLEDEKKNRMAESVALFAGIINLPWFKTTSVILFMNKDDIFKEKIQNVDPGEYFDDYHGGCDEMKAFAYIKEAYMTCDRTAKGIFCHRTCATDTEQISFVWSACKVLILKANLEEAGFMGRWMNW